MKFRVLLLHFTLVFAWVGFGPDVWGQTPTFSKLRDFTGDDGGGPAAGPIQGTDGNFYGTTEYGGDCSDGTVFTMTATGSLTALHSFRPLNAQVGSVNYDGAYPEGTLVQGPDATFTARPASAEATQAAPCSS